MDVIVVYVGKVGTVTFNIWKALLCDTLSIRVTYVLQTNVFRVFTELQAMAWRSSST